MPLTRLSRQLTGPRSAWVTLLLGVLVAVGVIGGLRGAEVVNDHGAAPVDSESAAVSELVEQLPGSEVQTLVVVVTREDGGELAEQDLGELGALGAGLGSGHDAVVPSGEEVAGPIPSEDGQAALLQVPVTVDTDDSTALRDVVDHVRDELAADLPAGLVAQTTGGPAFGADLAASFDGANFRLLLVTVGVVGLLLLLTYRSPVLWLVPITVVGLADQVSSVLTSQLGERLELNFDSGIISVLVFGAGANYALLLISRYREELRKESDHRVALRRAWHGSLPAILASNVSVVLALATLTLAVIPGTRGIGIAAAVGLLVALVFALFVLPPALAVVGRGAFWPFIPRPGSEGAKAGARTGGETGAETGGETTGEDTGGPGRSAERHGPPTFRADPWGAVATFVVDRPWRVLAAGAVLLAVMAGGLLGTQVGLTQTERFRVAAESADALQTISAHYPAGAADQLTVIAAADRIEQVQDAVEGVDGVDQVHPGPSGSTDAGERATLQVTGDAVPGSQAERDLVAELREAVHGIPDAEAQVGGAPATDVDVREGSERDLWVVAPLVLAVVALILAALLRSLVAPVVLMAVNIASTLATIGAGAWLGRQFFDWHALDTPVPLLAFLFLVALGIDYTIFLVHRVRSEVAELGTPAAVVRGVSTTGVVITSAGIVLAGVFAALGVLPLITLGQLGLIVGLGVVVDTMLVRTLIVPAIISILGDRFWWPGDPERGALPGEPDRRDDAAQAADRSDEAPEAEAAGRGATRADSLTR